MTVFNFGNMRLANFEISRYFCLGFIAGANISNIGNSQPAIPMVKTIMMAVLYRSVGVIFSLCSYAQMRWIDTWRIVARVHDYFSKRYFLSGKKFIRISMRSYRNFTRQQKNAISVVICCPSPNPASLCLFYSGFKNIVWAKLGELMQGSVFTRSVVTWPAKFAPDGRGIVTNNANNYFFGLISHFIFRKQKYNI